MPRYYFHVYDDIAARDDEGTDLPDAAAAHEYAVEGARDLAREEIKGGRLDLRHYIEVEDEQGRTVMTVPFRAAFRIEGLTADSRL